MLQQQQLSALLTSGDSFDQQLRALTKDWHSDSMGRHFPMARIVSNDAGVAQVGGRAGTGTAWAATSPRLAWSSARTLGWQCAMVGGRVGGWPTDSSSPPPWPAPADLQGVQVSNPYLPGMQPGDAAGGWRGRARGGAPRCVFVCGGGGGGG